MNRTNNLAVISLVAGALSWFAFPIAGAVAAIVAGHVARKEIRQTGEEGDVYAVIGLALGYIHLVMTCVVLAFVFVLYAGMFAAFLGVAATQG